MVIQQDPRVLRTRQLIREAFRELLQSKGFDSITIKDIAQRATINRATFYAHYEDKYALLEEITEQAFREMIPKQVMNALVIFSEYVSNLNKSKEQTFTTKGVLNYKEFKISNSKIKQLSAAVGINGGFWTTAIVKYFSYSPTALTLMLVAVPTLGMGVINACNSKGKGIIITQVGSGATNTYSCRSQ